MDTTCNRYNRKERECISRVLLLLAVLLYIVSVPCKESLSATSTDTFVDSLRSFANQPDVEVITVDETPRRKRFIPSPQVTVKTLEKDTWGTTTLGNLSTPIPQFEEYLIRKLTPDEYSKFYAAFTEGQTASKENNLKEAVRYYTEAISVAPFYYVGYMERAKILARNNKLSLAIQDFTTAIRVSPSTPDPYIFRAVTRTKERQYGLALEDYQSAIYLIGNNPILLDKQGEIQLLLDDFLGARMSYTQAIEVKPTESRYYYQRAVANSGLNNYSGMIQDYLRAINTNSYMQRLTQIRNEAISQLEKKYYPKEANPLLIIPSPEDILTQIASLPLYNPFQDIRTITPTNPAYIFASQIDELQREFPTSTFRIMQSYVAKGAYEDALSVLQEYMQSIAKTQLGFTSKSMLVFVGYLNQMLGRYEDANTAYSVFLHTTRKFRFFYCNYLLSMLQQQGSSATKDMVLKGRENIRDRYLINKMLSYLALTEGDYINAIRFMEEVVKSRDFTYYKLQLIALYALGKEYDKALSLAQRLSASKSSPFLADVYMVYGLTALQNGQYPLAVECFENVQQLLPLWLAKMYRYISIARAGQSVEALKSITEELKSILLSSKEKKELNAVKGRIEYDMGDYTKSLISYTIALNTGAVDSKELYYNIAFLELKKRNYVSALKNIDLFLEQYPDNPLGLVLKGDIELERRQVQSALENYKRAILLDKKSTYPYVHVANAIYALGIFDTAQKYYLTILEKSSDDVLNFVILAILNAQAGNIEESLEYCKRILEKDQSNAEAYLVQGIIYQRLGNLYDAYASYQKASELDSNNSFFYVMRGEILEKQQEYRKAISEITKAIEINPFSTEAYVLRGLLYLYLGDKSAGLLDLEAGKRMYILKQDKESATVIETMIYNITRQLYIQ